MQLVKIVALVFLAGFVGRPGVADAAEPVKSSLQPGKRLTTIFHPLNITGEHAGEPHCLVCENGLAPVAMLFARTLDEPLLKLLAKIDAATAKHRDEGLGSFAVFLNDDPTFGEKLSETAKKRALRQIVLGTFEPAGPEGFDVAAEAAVTVVLYRGHVVRANHAYRAGELNDQEIEKVLASLPKILVK